MMDGEPPPEQDVRILPKEVVERRSTNIIAVPHVKVAVALKYIWDHYTEPLTSQDVAREAGMCYRRLHDTFVTHVGRPISQRRG